MNVTRRDFLAGGSGIAVGAAMPLVFREAAFAAPQADRPGGDQTALVVIQLTGGNDGLNTVIPYTDPEYARARPTLKVAAGSVKKIDGELGFHPVMSGFSKLLEQSKLAIVQGVGYENSNRSHFASMDIWHKASRSKQQRYGWLGRAMKAAPGKRLSAVHVGKGDGPLALFSSTGNAPSLQSVKDYELRVGRGQFAESKRRLIEDLAGERSKSPASAGGLLDFVKQSARQTYRSSRQIQRALKAAKEKGEVGYPATGLGNRMKLIGRMIAAGVPERIFYTSIGGFDTHAAQAKVQPRLLQELSDAVAAFQKDLQTHGQQRRVLVMTFSEFGRRVHENGSGTDHGSASQMFLIGERVKSGPIGKHPSLTDLFRGDLKYHTDFRSVYATVLRKWLKLDPEPILGRKYPLVPALT